MPRCSAYRGAAAEPLGQLVDLCEYVGENERASRVLDVANPPECDELADPCTPRECCCVAQMPWRARPFLRATQGRGVPLAGGRCSVRVWKRRSPTVFNACSLPLANRSNTWSTLWPRHSQKRTAVGPFLITSK